MNAQDFEKSLRDIVGSQNVRPDEPLAEHTTFRIGGPAQWLVTPRSEDEVAAVVSTCEAGGVPWRVLGLGSNVLAPDEGLDGVTLLLADNFADVEVLPGGLVRAAAGATNAAVAAVARDTGLAGYEFASGIPGTVGGAAIMNAGAYEGQRGAGASDAGLVPDAPVAPELAAEAAPDVDAVLTVREFGRLLRLVGVDCTALSEAPFDNPLGLSTGAATIFGRTGGVMEAALRSAAFLITGENPDFSACDTTAATSETPWMSRELSIGDATVRIAVASGLENTSKLLDALESGEAAFDFVEIMACPGGCVGGGGQPIQFNSELAQARAGVLNRLDAADKLRYSHENPDIAKLYADWIGEPLSHTAHEWLHTDQESWQI